MAWRIKGGALNWNSPIGHYVVFWGNMEQCGQKTAKKLPIMLLINKNMHTVNVYIDYLSNNENFEQITQIRQSHICINTSI